MSPGSYFKTVNISRLQQSLKKRLRNNARKKPVKSKETRGWKFAVRSYKLAKFIFYSTSCCDHD